MVVLSLDLREMWRDGCPTSLDWDGDVEVVSAEVVGGGWRKHGGPPSTSD